MIENFVPIVIPAAFVGLILLERLRPARPLPRVRGWRIAGVVAFAVTGVVSSALPMLYQGFIDAHRLLDLRGLGLLPGTIVVLLVTEFFGYWFHRLRHTRVLWPVHQLHHSAERLDVFGSAYFHPLDIAGETLVGSFVSTVLLGVSAEAVALAGLTAVVLSLFQHTNVRTPRWRVRDPAPRVPQRSPCARGARLQLLRAPALGRRVRHLPQPGAVRGGGRLLRRSVPADRRHAARAGRDPPARGAARSASRDGLTVRSGQARCGAWRASGDASTLHGRSKSDREPAAWRPR